MNPAQLDVLLVEDDDNDVFFDRRSIPE